MLLVRSVPQRRHAREVLQALVAGDEHRAQELGTRHDHPICRVSVQPGEFHSAHTDYRIDWQKAQATQRLAAGDPFAYW